ncbi:MAG: FAD-dependent oxidoreductase [Deltaproteobacteria bacterium]|nr:FAD-dependent oxidoreductase [Deltaproteobacteria bacterium]
MAEPRVVIVGAGGAAHALTGLLRALGNDAQIDIFTDRPYAGYVVCEQPYFLRGRVGFDDMFYARKGWYEKVGARIHYETPVQAVDRERKVVETSAGAFPYDVLVLNTGAEPAAPPIPGLDGVREYHLTSDVRRCLSFAEAVDGARRAVVIGAGAIGLEVAEGLVERGFERVTVVEGEGHVLPRALDPDLAAGLEQRIRDRGVDLRTGVRVRSVRTEGPDKVVELPDGEIRADFVLLATGVRPRVELARAAGLEIGPTGGIAVDPFLRTRDPSVYAVGDCMETWERITGHRRPVLPMLASHTNRSGRLVARNIHHGPRFEYPGTCLPFGIELFGVTVATCGLTGALAERWGLDTVAVRSRGVLAKPQLGGERVEIKVRALRTNGRIVGVQAVGGPGTARMIDRAVLAVGEGVPPHRLSLYETVYSPTLNVAYDAFTQAVDRLLVEGGWS